MLYVDIDECQDRSSRCKEICINTIGSYKCTCKVGNFLLNDGISCNGKCNYSLTLNILIMGPLSVNGIFNHCY